MIIGAILFKKCQTMLLIMVEVIQNRVFCSKVQLLLILLHKYMARLVHLFFVVYSCIISLKLSLNPLKMSPPERGFWLNQIFIVVYINILRSDTNFIILLYQCIHQSVFFNEFRYKSRSWYLQKYSRMCWSYNYHFSSIWTWWSCINYKFNPKTTAVTFLNCPNFALSGNKILWICNNCCIGIMTFFRDAFFRQHLSPPGTSY